MVGYKTFMNNKLKAVLALAVLSPILSELLSGNSPAFVFFNPAFFLLQVFSYGAPALIIRELAVRWKLGVIGIFVMALGYGIFNEGLVTGTFFLKDAGVIANYGYHLGVNWPWVGFAMIWHDLHAMLYPILLVNILFSDNATEPWLSIRVVKILSVLVFLESLVLYFTPKDKFPSFYFLLFWGAIVLCILAGKKITNTVSWNKIVAKKSAFALGFSTLLFYVGLIAISKTTAHISIYFIVLGVVAWLYWKYLKKKNWDLMPMFLFFIVGDYTAVAVFASIGRPYPIVFITGIVTVLWLYWLAKRSTHKALFLSQ